jgi:hypothetical protein
MLQFLIFCIIFLLWICISIYTYRERKKILTRMKERLKLVEQQSKKQKENHFDERKDE